MRQYADLMKLRLNPLTVILSAAFVALVAFGPEGHAIRRLSPDALIGHFDELPDLARRWLD